MRKKGLDNRILVFPRYCRLPICCPGGCPVTFYRGTIPLFCLFFLQKWGIFLKKVLIFLFCRVIMDKRMSEITEQEV